MISRRETAAEPVAKPTSFLNRLMGR